MSIQDGGHIGLTSRVCQLFVNNCMQCVQKPIPWSIKHTYRHILDDVYPNTMPPVEYGHVASTLKCNESKSGMWPLLFINDEIFMASVEMIRIAIYEPKTCLIVHIEPLIPELWGVEWAKIGEISEGCLLQTRYLTETLIISPDIW